MCLHCTMYVVPRNEIKLKLKFQKFPNPNWLDVPIIVKILIPHKLCTA